MKMMSNREPVRIRRVQRGFALPAMPVTIHPFFLNLFCFEVYGDIFLFCRDRRTNGNTK